MIVNFLLSKTTFKRTIKTPHRGAFKYYVITLGGGPASIADADDALRGGVGVGVQNQNDDATLEYVFLDIGTWSAVIGCHQPIYFPLPLRVPG